MNTESQNKLIRKHLESGGSITSYEAFQLWGILRLSARIYDLKKQGMNITSEMVYQGKKHWKRYWLQSDITIFP